MTLPPGTPRTPDTLAAELIGPVGGGTGGHKVIIGTPLMPLGSNPNAAPATPQNVAEVRVLLPDDAITYGWDDDMIATRWTGGLATTVREYWYERTSDTASYLDLSDPSGSLPITQIHRQAREMLDYWDAWIKLHGDPSTLDEYYNMAGSGGRVSFGKIKRRYVNRYPYPVATQPNLYGPYKYTDP